MTKTDSSKQTLKGLPIKSKNGLDVAVVVVLAILFATWSTRSFGQFDKSIQKEDTVVSEAVPVVKKYVSLDSTTKYDIEPELVKYEEKVANMLKTAEILSYENDIKEVEIITEDEIIDNTAVGTKTNDGIDDLNKGAVKHEIVEEKPREKGKPKCEESVNMAMVEQKPQFPGGDAAMYKWIGENLNYPALAQEDGIQGKVYIQFVIEKDGSITNVKVARSKHQALDAEALRLVRSMPRWEPGRNNGHPFRVTYILPVTFKL